MEHNRIVGQLLTEIEGLRHAPVLTVLSTNLPENLDPAILSRLGLQIEVPLPGFAERVRILRVAWELGGKRTGRHRLEDDLGQVALATEGYAGRDLQRLLSNALLLAEGDDGRITLDTFREAAALIGIGFTTPHTVLRPCPDCRAGLTEEGGRCDTCQGTGYLLNPGFIRPQA